MKKAKKPLAFFLVCMLVMGVSAGISHGYLISQAKAENSFTAGRLDTEIKEEFPDPPPLKPGVSLTKKAKVENIGNVPAFVRVSVVFSDSDMEKLCREPDYDRAHWYYRDGYWYYTGKLQPGESTSWLFTEIQVKETALQESLRSFSILVYQESIDASDYGEEEYLTAWTEGKGGES